MIRHKMAEIIPYKFSGRLITVGFGFALVILVMVVPPVVLFLKRWPDGLWEERVMVATNMFQPFPNQTEIYNATIWQRIAKTQEMLKCSPSTVCSSSWLQVLSRPISYGHEAVSCPFYFKWIRQDLKPWAKTGITLDMVEAAKKSAYFRLTIFNGRLYVESYKKSYQTRDLFTIWGIAQLLKFYPGMVPDLDLMFNSNDRSVFQRAHYKDPLNSPPPLFRYCGTEDSFDIAFPDWSFWGWPEIRTPTWEKLVKDIMNGSREIKWEDRDPTAYWKGNPRVSAARKELMNCTLKPNWNGRVYAQEWYKEMRKGFQRSKLSEQCHHRYKIYIEGNAWSVSLKNILACDSPTLLITPRYHEFFSRGLVPRHHYWPVKPDKMCDSIQFAVNWGNNHTNEAKEIGKAAKEFLLNDLKMSNVYDYMFHVLKEYSKLLMYKPSIPKNASEYCSDTIACFATNEVEKQYLKDSMITAASPFPPCKLGEEEQDEKDIKQFLGMKAETVDYVKKLEGEWEKRLQPSLHHVSGL